MGNTRISLPFSGQKLRQLRERRGWLQQELSERCSNAGTNVARDRISRYENSRALPSAKSLRVLADVLEVEVDDLLEQRRDAA